MHLKQKGYFLIYAITIITLPSVGRCEPTYSSQPNSDLAFHNVRNKELTTTRASYTSSREDRQRQGLDSRQGEQVSDDGALTKPSGRRPRQRLRARMASSSSDTSFKNHQKPQTAGEWMYSSNDPSNEDCTKGQIKQIIKVQAEGGQGRIRGQQFRGSEESWQRLQPVVECGHDAMTLIVRRRRAVQLLLDRANESSVALSQLPPQCGYSVQTTWRDLSLMAHYDACHVTQEDGSYVLPLLWRGAPVKMSCPVSQIQPHATGLSSLCCSPYGMTVKVQRRSATEELRINVRGEWTPLVLLAERCGYILDTQGAEIVITAPYLTCGVTVKAGKYTLYLQIGEKTFTLSCPGSPPEEPSLTHQPLVNSRGTTQLKPETLEPFPWAPPFYLAPLYYPHPTYHHQYPTPDLYDAHNPLTPSSSTPDPTLGPKPLPPVDSQPVYLEHYSHQIPVREAYKQLGVRSSLSSTDEMEDSSQVYPDLQQKRETPVLGVSEKQSAAQSPCSATGSPDQVEAPSLQPPSYAFNPYYHYYHHPKIPLPGPPRDPDPGPEVPEELPSTNSHTREFPVLPPNVQQSEANSDQVPQSVPDAASHPYILQASPKSVHQAPAPPAPYPQPYPYHYFYNFAHISRGEAKRLAPLHHNMAAKTNLSDIHPLSRSSVLPVHEKYNVNPYRDQPNADEMTNIEKYRADRIKNPLLSEADDDDDVKPELDDKMRISTPVSPTVQPRLPPNYSPEPNPVGVPPPAQPTFPSQSNHNPPPYPYNYHPYYHYYQMYYAPEGLQRTDNHVSAPLSKEASDPLLQTSSSPVSHPSYRKHQTTASPTESAYGVQNGLLHPYYYYYYLFYQPKVSTDNQELHPAGSIDSEKASSKSQSKLPSDSDHSRMDSLDHAPEAGYPSIPWPLHSPSHSFYSHFMTQQHPYHPLGHPGGEEERLDDEMRDRLKANTYTPSASPCGLGPVSDVCCSYPVKDCTMGQHFVFVVPDSVVEPTLAPPPHPSENSNVSCTLQRLTSDPDIYTVPLDGCGVNKLEFGETVVHLLEVQGFHSLQQDHDSEQYSPIRLMVECSSSPGSPGEVRLHVMDQPPPSIQPTPASVAVQLRIAIDESFTSYHPEAHLPLSLMRGRPLYLEVSLLDPPEPDLVLLVHSCLAYTQSPYTSWILIHSRQGDSQLLSSPRSVPHHIRRIISSSFLSLPTDSSSYMAKGGHSLLGDPEIYFLCLTEVCSASDGDCTVSWSNNKFNTVERHKRNWEVVQ
ncbi:uncharacterized protein [Trachinotus anak]|uniref:uncharacterized protein isoform X2 n=1 Tax=Trachinotus anak TaxID=443729 RepID=UPI0039F18431